MARFILITQELSNPINGGSKKRKGKMIRQANTKKTSLDVVEEPDCNFKFSPNVLNVDMVVYWQIYLNISTLKLNSRD